MTLVEGRSFFSIVVVTCTKTEKCHTSFIVHTLFTDPDRVNQ